VHLLFFFSGGGGGCTTPSFFSFFGGGHTLQEAAAEALFDAAKEGNEDLVKTFIANGADVDGHRDKARKQRTCIAHFFPFMAAWTCGI